MQEIWKDIPEYEGLYQVSNLGRVKALSKKAGGSLRKEKILQLTIMRSGYEGIHLSKKAHSKYFLVHRLIMFVFEGKSDLQVNHIDGNKQNNRLNNLEYVTGKENHRHAWKNGLMENIRKVQREQAKINFRKYINNKKVKVKQYDKQGNFIAEYESLTEASYILNINQSDISSCINHPEKVKTVGGFIWKRA